MIVTMMCYAILHHCFGFLFSLLNLLFSFDEIVMKMEYAILGRALVFCLFNWTCFFIDKIVRNGKKDKT